MIICHMPSTRSISQVRSGENTALITIDNREVYSERECLFMHGLNTMYVHVLSYILQSDEKKHVRCYQQPNQPNKINNKTKQNQSNRHKTINNTLCCSCVCYSLAHAKLNLHTHSVYWTYSFVTIYVAGSPTQICISCNLYSCIISNQVTHN